MKTKHYSLLLAALTLGATSSMGQQFQSSSAAPNDEVKVAKRHLPQSQVKGGNILFYEDFQNGLAGNTSYGAWNTSGQDSIIWEHDFDGSSGQYSTAMDTLLSASSSNGWMMFDGDGSNPGNPPYENREGYLISPVIDLTGSPNVHMEFDHRFRFCCSYEFRLRVAVTTDGFQTMTKYIVSDPWQRNETPPNPVSMRFSITDGLAGGDLSNVQFRFEWEGLQVDGNGQGTSHYVWMIDDVVLRETLANDMVLTNAEHADYTGTGEWQYSVYSYNQIRPVTYKGWVMNDGVNDMTNVEMSVDAIGSSSSFSTVSPAISVMSLQTDSLLGTNTFTPTAMVDTFNISYSVTQDSTDMKPINNDTIGIFAVSPNVLARDLGDAEMSYTGGADQGQAFELCTGFDIVNDEDLTSIDVVFTSNTNLGILFDATVYTLVQDYHGESDNEYELTASDTSSFDGPFNWFNIVFADPLTLFAGESYLACVRHFGGDTLAIGMSGRSKSQSCLVYQNDDATWYNLQNIPMIRMNFDPSIGIEENANGNVGSLSAQPNPFTDQTTIKFEMLEGDDVTFTLTDVSGRLVQQEQLGRLAEGQQQYILNGANMEDGVYFYTLQTATGSVTERLVLQH